MFPEELSLPDFDIMEPDELARWHMIFQTLALYCQKRRYAKLLVKRHKMDLARQNEEACEDYYSILPPGIKWARMR